MANRQSPMDTIDWEEYTEKTPLGLLFRTPSQAEILSVFTHNQTVALTTSEIAQQANVTRKTVYECLPILIAFDIIEQTRYDGNSPLYQLNRESPLAYLCIQLDSLTLQTIYEKREEIDASVTPQDLSVDEDP